MPPSPAMRYSPGRELRTDNHKRGRSLEGGILFRERDDDLALFNEVQSQERDNFLLQSNDDFEDTFSTKLRYFSDYKLGISIPVRGESSDLLNADGEKNDYDWLLTPPETPLFHSLDDETSPVNLAQRGRPRSQAISISRSSTMEKSHRSSRGSASPNRLSPSPRSGNSTLQSRGRASSAPSSSPPATLRHATALRKPSSPSSKPSTPAPRSSTPTPRRMSTGSGGTVASSGGTGISHVKASRGNSASPKVRAWQSNIPGFSTEAPPNLRTSLADRPASYVRGSSPASRNGRDSSSKSGRQSMSPTASRSVTSSHSHEGDPFSSRSKGSVASSGDDDVVSLPSIAVSSSEQSASRKVGIFPTNRASFSKKPNRTVSSSSAPKRSFDLALRQMDHRKVPQNMFRPLLSSVPSSTFYAGKASTAHQAMISRNSSVTTSSNASSDLGTSGAHDNEGSEPNQEDVTSGCLNALKNCDVEDEVFVFDKTDVSNEDNRHGSHNGSQSSQLGDFNQGRTLYSQPDGSENLSGHDVATAITATSANLDVGVNFPDIDGLQDVLLCSECGRRYSAFESNEEGLTLCPDCHNSSSPLTIATPVAAGAFDEISRTESMILEKESESLETLEPQKTLVETPELTSMGEVRSGQCGNKNRGGQNTYNEPIWDFLSENSPTQSQLEEGEQMHVNHQVVGPPSVSYSMLDSDAGSERSQHLGDVLHSKVDVLEGAGISILLARSSSAKGPVVRSRNFSASSISYDDLSYMRDSTNSMRSSVGHGSASASSSVDLAAVRQTEIRFQRQLSSRKSDLESSKCDLNSKHRRSGSSLSGTSSHAFQTLTLGSSTHDLFEVSVLDVGRDIEDTTGVPPQEQLLASEIMEVDDRSTDIENDHNFITVAASTSESSSHTPVYLGETLLSNLEESGSSENIEDSMKNTMSFRDIEASTMAVENSTIKKDAIPNSCVDSVDVAEAPIQSPLHAISEAETENTSQYSPGSQYDAVSPSSESSRDELQDPSEKDIAVSMEDSEHALGIVDESTVMIGGQGGIKARSLTLEEATDSILFCSSIVHNLAYEAATIAIEKENPVPLQNSWPLIPIMGKAGSDRKDQHNRNAGKHTSKSKSQKARPRKVETDTVPPSSTNSDEKFDLPTTRIVGVPNNSESVKPPKLESKCNCTIM